MKASASFELGGRRITLETGTIARQAHGSVVVRSGKAVVLVTVVIGPEPRGEGGFFPLTVEYREKMSAAGRIPGAYGRREGRISDHEVLVSRLVDRTLRPLFPEGFRREVQVQAIVFSADPEEVEAPMLALLGAGAALHLSPAPWAGPAAGVRIARIAGDLRVDPAPSIREGADADLVVSASRHGLVMVEGGCREQSEARLVEMLAEAERALAPCLDAQDELRAAAGAPKDAFAAAPAEAALEPAVRATIGAALADAVAVADKAERRRRLAGVRQLAQERHGGADPAQNAAVAAIVEDLVWRAVRARILDSGMRLDGRGAKDIRPIAIEVGWLPSPHGSAVFTRGQTQAVVTCTLGSQQSQLTSDTLSGPRTQRFLLHYNFPGYSVGEARAIRGPGRREIGHGALAARALEAVLPSWERFPYVVRVESEITESNGSSSMATVCGGCLALMDAGVPVAAPVAGIAMGLMSGGDGRFAVLSDILGDEDHLGDMDFKVAGTREGVTAVQLDNKVGALPMEVLQRALAQAREGRMHILDRMAEALPAPRPEVSQRAPRGFVVKVAPDSVGALIGPKGQTIKALQQSFGVEIAIEDDGTVTVWAPDSATAARARLRIRELAGLVEVGKLYQGKVTGVKDFGAFVRIYDTAEGLVHVSDWDVGRVEDMARATREGETVIVRVLGVDNRGRLKLSRREALGRGSEPVENA